MVDLINFASGIAVDASVSAAPIKVYSVVGREDALSFNMMHNVKFGIPIIITFSLSVKNFVKMFYK